MKILLICNTSGTVTGFRKALIDKLRSEGIEVAAIAFDEAERGAIERRGVEFTCIEDNNRGINPFRILTLGRRYRKAIEKIKPDAVFTFMLKPNLFGLRAAKKAGVGKRFAMVEGAGDVFINGGLKWAIVRRFVCMMYRRSFRRADKVFFLNHDDSAEFVARKLVKEKQVRVIPGIGVDLEHFACRPVTAPSTFLMVARMLKTKGVLDYCEAARLVRKTHPDAVFNYLGGEGTVKLYDIRGYIDDGSIRYLGTVKDVRPQLGDCTVFVLPSYYREGLPMSVMEAEATGRAIVTSNFIGCRDTVIDGYNGFSVECGDVAALAEKCIYFLEHPQAAAEMGANSRKFAEEHFDQRTINQILFEEIMA